MTTVLFAVSGIAQEAALLAAAPECGVTVARRCVDTVDALATSIADPTAAILVSAGLPRLSRDAIERMDSPQRPVVGLAEDDESAGALRALGITRVVAAGSSPQASWRAIGLAIASASVRVDDAVGAVDPPAHRVDDRPAGRIIAIWGPTGAPGRTTIAIALADALSERGLTTVLVDADTYGPSVAMALGVRDETSGIVVACRQAELGSLTSASLHALARPVRTGLQVLTGVATSARWTDIRASALGRLWSTCREAFDVTVVDVGFCLEDDGDDAAAWSRPRNAAAVTAVAGADRLVAVGNGTPMGAARLVDSWPRVAALSRDHAPVVVANRVRGARLARQWTTAVRELGVSAEVRALPDDPDAVTRAWSRAQTPGEGRRRSALRRSVHGLAALAVSG